MTLLLSSQGAQPFSHPNTETANFHPHRGSSKSGLVFSFYLTWYFFIWFPVWGGVGGGRVLGCPRGITQALSLCRIVWMTFTLVCQYGWVFFFFSIPGLWGVSISLSRTFLPFQSADTKVLTLCLQENNRKTFMRNPSWQTRKDTRM